MNQTFRSLIAAVVVVSLLTPQAAQASMWGEENASLIALIAQGVEQIQQGAQQFEQMKQTYEETRKYVSMAQDAVDGFKEFGTYVDSIYKNPGKALATAFPDAESLTRDLQTPESWAQGTGELQRLVRVCLAGGDCASLREAVTAKQVRDSISKTFGTSPVRRDSIDTIDIEVSRGISTSTAQNAKAQLSVEQARALMDKCRTGTDQSAIAACQAAANMGQIMQVEQTAELNAQMAESNRLKALEMADKNAEKKATLMQAVERHKMLEAGSRQMAPPTFLIGTEDPALNSGAAR